MMSARNKNYRGRVEGRTHSRAAAAAAARAGTANAWNHTLKRFLLVDCITGLSRRLLRVPANNSPLNDCHRCTKSAEVLLLRVTSYRVLFVMPVSSLQGFSYDFQTTTGACTSQRCSHTHTYTHEHDCTHARTHFA